MAFIVIRLALFAALLIYNCGMALESDFTDVSSDPNAPDKAVAATTYRDCEEYCASGDTSTGVKPILINGNVVNVFCYGCWTAIQSRTFGSMDFNLTFDQYRNVIGRATSPPSDFYLGNDNIYTLTNQKNMQLWVEIKDCDSVVTSETYTSFRIGNLSEKFSLHTDNVGGALNYKVLGISDNGRPFATAATYDPNGGLPVSHCPALLYGYGKIH
uniref:Fibrinogen C-terminal domain-containing protein n=1 Tax=Plectus sambesii TaxID=2011161 RepID=A0A914X4H8_9BILA